MREYRRVNKINAQSRETGSICYTRRGQTTQKHSTICARHHYAQKYTNNVNKTWALLQTTGGKYELNIVLFYYVSTCNNSTKI